MIMRTYIFACMSMTLFLLTVPGVRLATAASSQVILTPTSGGSITDASGAVWQLSTAGSLYENNSPVSGGGGTAMLVYVPESKTIWGKDAASGQWYTWDGRYWMGPKSSPLTQSTGTTVLTPTSGGSFVDATGALWQLSSVGSVMQNASALPGGGGTAQLVYIASTNTVWGQDAKTNQWYIWDGHYWVGSNTSPLAQQTNSQPQTTPTPAQPQIPTQPTANPTQPGSIPNTPATTPSNPTTPTQTPSQPQLPQSLPIGFAVGARVRVIESRVNVRSSAQGVILKKVSRGQTGTIIAGPVMRGGLTWWKVQYDNGVLGWSAARFQNLALLAVVTTPNTGSTNPPTSTTPNLPTTPTTPPTSTNTPTTPTPTATGNFRVANGKIYDPQGTVFFARGINIGDPNIGQSVLDLFPGITFVRFAIGSYQPPSYFQNIVNTLTAKHVVVEIEYHPWPLTRAYPDAAEAQWYASLAQAYKNNPYVWFGTMNEPQNGYGADEANITAEQMSVYNAIRGTGSQAIVMLEAGVGAGNPQTVGAGSGLTESSYATMHNVVWDLHFYGWVANGSTDQNYMNSLLLGSPSSHAGVSAAQTIRSADGIIPVIVGEFGNSTDGATIDANGNQVISAVTSYGPTIGTSGFAAWHWFASNNPGDLLTQYGQPILTDYGKQIANIIKTSAGL